MEFFHTGIDDHHTPTREQLESVLNFANLFLNQDKKILIHCQNGSGRAPLIATAVLVKRGMSASDARRIIEEKHPAIGFSAQQEEFISGLDDRA